MTKIQRNPAYKAIHQNKDKRYVIITGGRGCFAAGQDVICRDRIREIQDIKEGDEVLSYNEKTKESEFKKVKKTFKYSVTDDLVHIKLKDGTTIDCTLDHKFFFRGEWLQIQEILRIFDKWKNGEEYQTTDYTNVQQKEE